MSSQVYAKVETTGFIEVLCPSAIHDSAWCSAVDGLTLYCEVSGSQIREGDYNVLVMDLLENVLESVSYNDMAAPSPLNS